MNGMPEQDGPVLPADRHQLLREHLMSEINRENATTARPVRRIGWVALPALAGALSLAVVLNTGGGTGPVPPPAAVGPASPGTPNASAASGTPVKPSAPVQLLDRIAQVAAAKPAPEVKDSQFVHVKSLVKFPDGTPDGPIPGKLHEREVWLSVDGSRKGLLLDRTLVSGTDPESLRRDGANPDGTLPLDTNTSPDLHGPTYRYLAGLPTDPDEMFKLLNSEPRTERWTEQRPFGTIGDLLREQIAPPAVAAALYRAAAKIPGVEVIEDSVDASGRHGVAVGLTSSAGVRVEWIFDRKTFEYLGERQIVVSAGTFGKPGDVVAETAVLSRAIVDKPGQQP
ncbi:CU044_5270 family protein [Kitasatospora sp. NPDC051914]|uniref:CU044_5270 family protein n=1 Tax=Kitasatospora sp. NPDC051914 TaxID=3154945 RepID=UPI00343CC14B